MYLIETPPPKKKTFGEDLSPRNIPAKFALLLFGGFREEKRDGCIVKTKPQLFLYFLISLLDHIRNRIVKKLNLPINDPLGWTFYNKTEKQYFSHPFWPQMALKSSKSIPTLILCQGSLYQNSGLVNYNKSYCLETMVSKWTAMILRGETH